MIITTNIIQSSIFLQHTQRNTSYTPPSFLILLISNLFIDLLFSTYELTGDHKFRERRYIIYTYKSNR